STIIRLSGKYKNVEELANLVIAVKDGAQIRLSDVAFVEDAQKDAEKVARIDRKPAILLQVVKQSDANAVEVSELTKQTIEKIEKDYAQQG
ncbi:efflux RND transporter permease subunit, partial [Klebsiella pneumoniae]